MRTWSFGLGSLFTGPLSTKRTVGYRVGTGGITDREAQSLMDDFRSLRREDMSSTIPTITKRLPGIVDLKLRMDLDLYMDLRIGVALVGAVRAGNIGYARHIPSLFQWLSEGESPIGCCDRKTA